MKKIYILCALAVLLVTGCNSNGNQGVVSGSNITPMPPKQTEATESAQTDKIGRDITGVLLSINADEKKITVRKLDDAQEFELIYNGATDVRNDYDEVVIMQQLDPVCIVDVVFDSSLMKALSVKVSDEAFKSSRITGFKADYTKGLITFGAGNYKYDDNIAVISSGQLISASQVMSRDEVTVWGIGNKIYGVSVDKGHGYVSFTGYDQFIGGTVQIGRSFLYKISSNMIITIPEGEYKITMTNGTLTGSKTIQVVRDMDAVIDFSEFRPELIKSGTVEFDISPKKSALYIDGKKTDYVNPVVLDYGRYTIRVVSDGYDDYTSVMTVDSLFMTKTIHLDDATEAQTGSTQSASEGTTQSGADSNSNTSNTTSGTSSNTSNTQSQGEATSEGTGNGNLIIETPVGADVYIDTVYAGTTPLTIKKNPGEHVITFHKSGYATKSYAVDVSYEDADQRLSFPEMNEE